VKTTHVNVYVKDELVGSGELAYDDRLALSVSPYTVRHCDESTIYIGDAVVPLQFCWDDIVASWFGGVVKRTMEMPVYLGDILAGSAVVDVYDSYSHALSTIIYTAIYTTMFLLAVVLVLKLITKRK